MTTEAPARAFYGNRLQAVGFEPYQNVRRYARSGVAALDRVVRPLGARNA